MANNKFQIKRTTVSGRTPNTTNSGNTHFIDTGELALNLTDGKMFSSNGSVYFEVGSNLENISITSNATFGSSGKIIANGAFGTDGQVLASNGTTMYWATGGGGSGTVTQVNTGNGLSGGPITTTGTLSVVANNGLASNSTGVFVVAGTGVTSNATGVHIGQAVGTTDNVIFNDVTINGNTSIGNNTSDLVSFIAGVNTSLLPAANNNQLGNSTQRWALSANTIDASGLITGGDGATITGQVNASTGFGSGTINATSNGLFANATTILLGNSSVNVAISTSGITAKTGSFDGAVSGITTLAAGNTTVTGFANVSTSVNSALLTVGTSFIANTTAVVIATPMTANGSTGTSGQVLASNGSSGSPYWVTLEGGGGSGTVTQVSSGDGLSGGPITTTGTLSVVANNGLASNSTGVHVVAGTGVVSNATGVHVNSSYIATISSNNSSYLGGVESTSYVQNTDSRTLSGNLVISGSRFTPSSNTILLGNSTSRWIVSANSGDFTANIAMNSNYITGLSDPVGAQDAATKAYVDAFAQGLHIHESCAAATPDTLATITGGGVTYDNGTSGVGATLTLAVALTTLDGYTLVNGDRIVVKNEVTAAHNGIYTRTSSTVLTRSTDFDTGAEVDGGDFTFVTNGTLYNSTGWVQIDTVTTMGTDAIAFQQFSGQGTFTAGDYLYLTGSQFNANATSTSTASVLVARDSSQNFAANTVTLNSVSATTGTFSGAVSGITTLAAGNTTITGFANVSSDIFADGAVTSDQFRLTQNVLGNVSGATTINLSNGSYVTATATGAVTWTVTNATSPAQGFILKLTNGGVGTQTWMDGTKFASNTAPTLTASGVDILTFITDDSGSTFKGVLSIANCS